MSEKTDIQAKWSKSGPHNYSWTKRIPVASGMYWHSHGDPDSAPVPLNVAGVCNGRPSFVMCGQYGYSESIDCEELGGWWMPVIEPIAFDGGNGE